MTSTRHFSRRNFLQTAAGGLALASAPGLVLAQAGNIATLANPAKSAETAAAARLAQDTLFNRQVPAKPLLFAHRGSSALRPEHTLASYAKAIADGADFIEPDLCMTKDAVLVARHENNLTETTDVASRPEFAHLRTTKTIDGQTETGWYVSDFTLKELKTLRAVERLKTIRLANQQFDGEFQIQTFEEIIEFVAAESSVRGRAIGIIPEIKHSTFFHSVGLAPEDQFMAILKGHEYTRRAPIEIQSFEVANLKYLRSKLGRPDNIRLMQLVVSGPMHPADVAAAGGSLTFDQMNTPAGMRDVASYADVIAPPTRVIIPLGKDERLAAPSSFVKDAHDAGLLVHIWTFRPENCFLAADFRNGWGVNARNPEGSIAEIRRYIETGIDGLFSDDSAVARTAIG